MLGGGAQTILIFLLSAVAVGGLLTAVLQSRMEGDRREAMRFEAVVAGRRGTRQGEAVLEGRRKQTVEETLRELDQKQRALEGKRHKVPLQMRLRQGGLGWSKRVYVLVCLLAGAFSFLLGSVVAGFGPVPSLGFALAGGLLLPHGYVGLKRKKRFAAFSNEFANAMDVIVRGVKSGLPLSDCIRIIAAEAEEPVRSEFKTIIDDHTLGLPLDEAVGRLPERVPVSEAVFFAIVIAIQGRSGGSLSEALANLSKVVRERRKMKGKIQAMSQEAKASAGIIGALPFVVAGLVYLTSPDYISLLFTTLPGNIILGVSAFWMLTGILVMRKMINFDF